MKDMIQIELAPRDPKQEAIDDDECKRAIRAARQEAEGNGESAREFFERFRWHLQRIREEKAKQGERVQGQRATMKKRILGDLPR